MWPFKKKPPPITLEEWAKQFPPAPCGSQTLHYEWKKINGMSCPICVSLKQEAQRLSRQRELAEAIAEAVVRQLTAGGHTFK